MDGLIFTPRQADFLKDGSIFAQSPAKTSNIIVKPHLPTADSKRFASFAKLHNHFVVTERTVTAPCTLCAVQRLSRGMLDVISCPASPGLSSKLQVPVRHKPMFCTPPGLASQHLIASQKTIGRLKLLTTPHSCQQVVKMTWPSKSEQSLKTLCVRVPCPR